MIKANEKELLSIILVDNLSFLNKSCPLLMGLPFLGTFSATHDRSGGETEAGGVSYAKSQAKKILREETASAKGLQQKRGWCVRSV